MHRYLLACIYFSLLVAALSAPAAASTVDAAMMRYPDISATQIVFIYDNDVWIVPKEGGIATPLSSPAGRESMPKFSPDGSEIAFCASYDGNTEVYTLPASGGLPQRLTCDPWQDYVLDYTPGGKVMFAREKPGFPHADGFFTADPHGGLPTELPVPFGAFGSVSEDGQWLAYTHFSFETSNWKRYRGGRDSDIWLFNLDTLESKCITDHPGLDDLPMWHGDALYYLSDAGPANRRNIWAYDMKSGKHRQVTRFTEFDVRWPSIGPDSIVFQYGSELRVLNLENEQARTVDITIPGDHPDVRKQVVDVSDMMDSISISPNAKRVTGSFRGDIWTVPAEEGYPRNLTATSGVAERSPAWSPDGRWIAYFSDETGDYELYIRPSDGSGEAQQLTRGSKTYYHSITWSPDSQKLSYVDRDGKIYVCIRDSKEVVVIDDSPWSDIGVGVEWAKDSNWLAYSVCEAATNNFCVVLYNLAERERHPVTTPLFNCVDISFDTSGDWLFFRTNQEMNAQFSDLDRTFIFTDSDLLAAVPLRTDVENPFAPKNDDEEMESAEDEQGNEDAEPAEETEEVDANSEDGEDTADATDEDEDDYLKIDTDGIEQRVMLLPLPGGNYHNLLGGDKKVIYMKSIPGEGWQLMQYSLSDKEETKLLDGINFFTASTDRKNLLVSARGKLYITTAGPGAKLDDPISLRNMLTELDPRAEWRQMVHDAWRFYRDYFYDPGMHGVDWPAQLDHALELVEHAANREDVSYIVGEMIAELNVGHAYTAFQPSESAPTVLIGCLGCDFERGKDADGNSGVQISRIYHGGNFEYDQRGPLSQYAVDVHEGDFLLAVNGIALGANESPYKLLTGTVGQPTQLTVSTKAVRDGSERDVLVTPASDEYELRIRDWIDTNRRYVEEQSGGRIGYIYLRSTSYPNGGLEDLQRQFIGQRSYDGLIIDERWNSGGMIPDRFIEMLNRPVLCYWAERDTHDARTPDYTHPGPKAMLINQRAGSGGDALPYFFRKLGMGPLIGTRTWGGLVGIRGVPSLIDGSYVTVPTFGIYEVDGTWTIEGYGVDPDIEVINDPTLAAQGKDPQLDKAIEVVLEELKTHPWQDPPRPAFPDRSGAGTKVEDR